MFHMGLDEFTELQRVVLQECRGHFGVHGVERSTVHHYGKVRATLEAAGNAIGPLDRLIAAHALALEPTLVTHNTRQFQHMPDRKVEDWA